MNRIVSLLCVPIVLGLSLRDAPATGGEAGKFIKIEADMKNLSDEQKTAVELAKKFLVEKKVNWGMAEKMVLLGPNVETIVGKGKQIYTIYYPTPEKEIPLLGPRGLYVNVATKKVNFVERD